MAVLQLEASVLPADWAEICAREGITAGSSWVKLMAARGCRRLVSETDGSHDSSPHNMLRLGFRVLYERQNWVWQAG